MKNESIKVLIDQIRDEIEIAGNTKERLAIVLEE
jgi:hypothetical protein